MCCKKTIKLVKGYSGSKHALCKVAKQQVVKSGQHASRDRHQYKRDSHKLWIIRVNAVARQHGMSYSHLTNGLKKAGINTNHRISSGITTSNERALAQLVTGAKDTLK